MTTKEAIQTEFMKEYSQKDEARITVKELCVNTPVARTTFYSYYQNIEEVKEDIENSLISGLKEIAQNISKGNIEQMDFSLFLSETMEYIKVYWEEICAFLIIQPNIRFIQKWKEAIKRHFLLRFPQKVRMPNYELIAETIASGVIGAYTYWLQNPEKVNISKLNQIVLSIMDSMMEVI